MGQTSSLQHKLRAGTIVPIYKPIGLTSHDVINQLRAMTGIARIGHAGTLDPMAEGVLVIGIGRSATRQLSKFLRTDKEYQAEITLGYATDTYDALGQPTEANKCWKTLTKNQLGQGLKQFIGPIDQVPPLYSAKKISGQKAYELAREGKSVELKPSRVTIYSIDLLNWRPPKLTINVTCSSGTYIRSLAYDLGQKLNCPAHLSGLIRTRVGEFTIDQAHFLPNRATAT